MKKGSLILVIILFTTWLMAPQDKIYFDSENNPYMYQDNGAAGLYPALVKEIYKRINRKVICISVPWIRALSEARNNPVGIAGLYKNDERETVLDFTEPIYQENIVVYYLNTSDISYSKLLDLYGKKVGVIRGWSYGNYFDSLVEKKYFTVEENTSDTLNIKKLLNGRLDAVIAVSNSGDSIVKAIDANILIKRSVPILQLNVYIAFNKKMRKLQDILELNKVISDMKIDGTIQRIANEELNKKN